MIEGVRTFDQIKSLIKFFVFRKTGEKKTEKIVFHVIFNQYLDLIFDFFFVDIFDDFVFCPENVYKKLDGSHQLRR